MEGSFVIYLILRLSIVVGPYIQNLSKGGFYTNIFMTHLPIITFTFLYCTYF